MIPGSTSPMHRTVSLDYGCVIEGEVECVLDSGEVKLLKRGDVCVQRGESHHLLPELVAHADADGV